MTEYEYNQSEAADSNEPAALAHMQDDVGGGSAAPGSKKSVDTGAPGMKKPADAAAAKPKKGDAAEAPARRPPPRYDKRVSEKLGQIISGQEDLIFAQMAQSGRLVPKVGFVVATQMAEEKIAEEKIPGYDKLSEEEQKEKREEFFKNLDPAEKAILLSKARNDVLKNNQLELSERTKSQIFDTIRKELDKKEFGEASRAAYSSYIDAINSQTNATAKILVNQELEFPTSGCPIKIPEDTRGKYDTKRFREAIKSGEAQSRLSNYNETNLIPGVADIDELVQAEHFRDQSLALMSEASLGNQAKTIQARLELVFLNETPPGLLPDPKLLEKGADAKLLRDYVERAKPVVDLIEQVNNATRAIKALKETPDTLSRSTEAKLDALLQDFPGDPPYWDGSTYVILPTYPKNLLDIEENRGISRASNKWLKQAYSPLKDIKKECDFASRNPDSVCHWAHIDAYGVDPATGKQYNRIEYRYTAEPVKVQVMRVEDGTTALEDRIKVTTSKQYQWAGIMPEVFGATDIGKPVVSGRATANGALLDPSGKSISLKGKAEVRLSKDGIIQAKVIDGNAGVRLVDAKGKSYELKPDKSGNDQWYDVLPGLSLKIGQEKVDLKNDIRLYKPDQTVAVKGGSGFAQLVQASQLPAQRESDAAREFLSEAVPLLVDVGFTLTGALEVKALTMAPALARKVAAEVAAEAVARTAVREEAVVLGQTALSLEEAVPVSSLARSATFTEEAGAMPGLARATTMTEEAVVAVSTLEDLALIKAQRLSAEGLTSEDMWATGKSAVKHLGLGGFGLVRHPVEAWLNEAGKTLNIDRAGSKFYAGRGAFMSADMMASSGWTGALGRNWTKLFAGNEKLIAAGLSGYPLLQMAKAVNEKALKIADLYYGPQMSGELAEEGVRTFGLQGEIIEKPMRLFGLTADHEKRAKQEGKALMDLSERMSNFKGQAPELIFAERLVSLLHKEDQQAVKNALDNISREETDEFERESKVSELATDFLSTNSDRETKLIAALGLLKIRYKADGSLPDVLAAHNSDTASEPAVSLADVRDYLLSYNPIRFRDLAKQPVAESFNKSVRNFVQANGSDKKLQTLIDETNNALKLKDEDPVREKHIHKLSNIFQSSHFSEKEKMIAGMGLLFLGTDSTTGSVKQTLGERQGYSVTMETGGYKGRPFESTFWGMDEQEARQAAMQPYARTNVSVSITNTTPLKEIVKASEVAYYLRQQLARTDKTSTAKTDADKGRSQYVYPAEARLDLADTLMRCGQINPEDHGGICLEMLTDPRTKPETKAAALIEENSHRVAELLTAYNGEGLTEEAKRIVDEVINNTTEDRNVRALALAVANISTIGSGLQKGVVPALDQLQRTAKFKALQESWRASSHGGSGQNSASKQNGDGASAKKPEFADLYLKTLVDNLETKEESKKFERSQDARTIVQLADASIVNLTKEQKETVYNNLLQSLDIIAPPGGAKFVDVTLDITPQERESARKAIGILANHIDELNGSDIKFDMPKLRTRMTEILSLPNPDSVVDPEGESRLKVLALANIGKIYEHADASESKNLAEALKKDIMALRIPAGKENDGLVQKFTDLHKQLIKAEIESLSQLALSQSKNNQNESAELRDNTIKFLKELALPANKAMRSWAGHAEITIGALTALNNMRPVEGLHKLCSDILERENNVAVREEAEGLRKLLGVQDPDSYNTEYLKSKRDIRDAINIKLTELPDTISLGIRDLCLTSPAAERLNNTYTEAENLERLRRHMEFLPDAILKEGYHKGFEKYNSSVINGYAYLLSSGGDPLIPPFNDKAVEFATKGWAKLEESDRPDIKKTTGPLSGLLLVNSNSLPYAARQEVLKGMLRNDTLSDKEKATIISMALEQEYHRTPHNIANPHFKESQDYQLALLDALKPLQTREQIPVLAAIVDDKPKSSLGKDATDLVNKVNYPDRSSRSAVVENGKVVSFCFTDRLGKNDKWLIDKESGDFFKESDKDKKFAWHCKPEFLANGDFVITDAPNPLAAKGFEEYQHGQLAMAFSAGLAGERSPGGTLTFIHGSKTIYTRDGATVVEIPLGGKNGDGNDAENGEKYADGSPAHRETDTWVQITYADGSVRSQECNGEGRGIYGYQFEPAGGREGLSAETLSAADSLNFPLSWYKNPPAWFSALHIDRSLDSTGYNRDTHSFWRDDLSVKDGVKYRMTLGTDGRKTMERHEGNSQNPQITTLFMNSGADNTAAHPMPLVRQKALAMLASFTAEKGAAPTDTQTNSSMGPLTEDQIAQALHERYGAVKLAIESSKNNQLVDFRPESVLDNDRYQMLDAKYLDAYAKKEADKKLSGWWIVGCSADYAGASAEAMMQAEKKVDRLKVTASGGLTNVSETDIPPKQARLMLASLALHDRGFLGKRAIKAIGEMGAGTGDGASEMMDVVAHDVIGEPTIGTLDRVELFKAIKSHAERHPGSATKARMAQACWKILEIEYQTMPNEHGDPYFRQSKQYSQSELYEQSEQLQADCLAFLKNDVRYDGNMASAKALYELSPSRNVKLAAAELLRLPPEIIDNLRQEIAKSQASRLGDSHSRAQFITGQIKAPAKNANYKDSAAPKSAKVPEPAAKKVAPDKPKLEIPAVKSGKINSPISSAAHKEKNATALPQITIEGV